MAVDLSDLEAVSKLATSTPPSVTNDNARSQGQATNQSSALLSLVKLMYHAIFFYFGCIIL